MTLPARNVPVAPSLFGFPLLTESRLDLSDADGINLEQATHEWRLARDFGQGPAQVERMAEWARRWADALLDVTGGGEREKMLARIDHLEDELDAAERASTDTWRVEEGVDGADACIHDALEHLGERPVTVAAVERAVEHLNDARKDLDRASRELEKL